MRLVSHPNVVDLKAFFYSNGDKVRHCSIRAFENTETIPVFSMTEG
jgi:hypothetical protein